MFSLAHWHDARAMCSSCFVLDDERWWESKLNSSPIILTINWRSERTTSRFLSKLSSVPENEGLPLRVSSSINSLPSSKPPKNRGSWQYKVSVGLLKSYKSFRCTVPTAHSCSLLMSLFLERTWKNCFTNKIPADNQMTLASSNSYWRRITWSPAVPSPKFPVLPYRRRCFQSHYYLVKASNMLIRTAERSQVLLTDNLIRPSRRSSRAFSTQISVRSVPTSSSSWT